MAKLEDLVVRAQVGDARAYDAIFQRFQDMALSYAYSILGDFDLAEDAKQEAFLAAYCDLLSLRDPAAFPGWFRSIVRRRSISIKRGRNTLAIPLDGAAEVASREPSPAAVAHDRDLRQKVERAIARLPAAEREATRLYYVDGLALKDIARQTGIAQATVKSRLHTARARLRQRLTETVKEIVSERRLTGDRAATESASDEAVAQFTGKIDGLLRRPSDDEQRQAGDLLCARGRLERYMGRMDQAIASFDQGMAIPALASDSRWRARLRAERGLTYVQTSDYTRARAEFQASRSVLRRTRGHATLLAGVLNGLGMCAWGEGDFPRARRLYQETVRASRRAGCDVLEVQARNNLALLDWKSGRLDKALVGLRLCLRRWKSLGNRFGQALATMNIGLIEENLGRPTPAARHYDQAMSLAQEIGFVQLQAAADTNLGNLALIQGRWRRALDCSTRARNLARGIGDRRSQAIALENVALANIGLGENDAARRALRQARRIAEAIGDAERLVSLDLVEIERRLASRRLALGRPAGVDRMLDKAERTIDAKGYAAEAPRLARLRAHAQVLRGDDKTSRKAIADAARVCRKQRNRPEEKRTLALEKLLGTRSRKPRVRH